MKDYSYYTPVELACKILDLLPKVQYDEVIDICCGSWNLLKAAKELFGCKKIYGVDVDQKVENIKIDDAMFFLEDGRKFSLKTYKKKKFDLVLSNPPFGRIDDENCIMKAKMPQKKYAPLLKRRYENEMFLANMLLVKPGGVLVAIVPQTFVFGSSNIQARKVIAKDFYVSSIISLPQGTFKSKDICATAIVLERRKSVCDTKYYTASYSGGWEINYIKSVDKNCILSGDWDGVEKRLEEKRMHEIFRGNISSNCFSEKGKYFVYHCSSIYEDNQWKPLIKKSIQHADDRKQLKKNDILINRIGKFAGYWRINNQNGFYASDCILVLRDIDGECLKKLQDKTTGGRLNIPIRGVATKYVTKEDIEAIL